MTKIEFNLIGKKPKLRNPVLIEGLPGIGNVGKIAADFLVDELGAKKIYEIFSYSFPHSVFVTEDSLVDLPTISIYHKKIKKSDVLFLTGDIQPIDEESCYEFCDKVIDLVKELKCKQIITLGGIGLHGEPKKPKVYCTGTNRSAIKKFTKGFNINHKLFGVIGPIIGVSGLLLGLAKRKNIDALSLLAETSANPVHLGIKGAKELIEILNKKFSLGVNLKNLNKEIELIEKDNLKRAEQFGDVFKRSALKKFSDKLNMEPVDYIG